MLPSEKLAIAAHLHVLLRRKTGRVTDTEWLAANAEYATEIVRFARARAKEDGHADLAEWADKLAATMVTTAPVAAPQARAPAAFSLFRSAAATPSPIHPPIATKQPVAPATDAAIGFPRYVNGIR
ncbi:MAG: hypothetical protein CFE43_19440 [Burkholderiales bacterium PBB3]|jgi:hypothetical protein|nr:MAG: hypothetical protein CFE43_19440 [Burkholderiales bacterium PBB3]